METVSLETSQMQLQSSSCVIVTVVLQYPEISSSSIRRLRGMEKVPKHRNYFVRNLYSTVYGACKDRVTPAGYEELGSELTHGCSVEKVVLGFCVPGWTWVMKRGWGERKGVCLQGAHGPRVPMQPGRMARWYRTASILLTCHAVATLCSLLFWLLVLFSPIASPPFRLDSPRMTHTMSRI